MKKEIDFTKLSNAEINIKIMGYENEYNAKKDKIVALLHDLEELDSLYIKANKELQNRDILKDG